MIIKHQHLQYLNLVLNSYNLIPNNYNSLNFY